MGKKFFSVIIIIFLLLPLMCLSFDDMEVSRHFHKHPRHNYMNLNLTCRKILLNQFLLNSINILFNINIVSRNLIQTVKNEFVKGFICLKIVFIRPPPLISIIPFPVSDIQLRLQSMMYKN
ncbi:MAG: hypothetical protein ABRQ37_00725 [Candidatus Eremiobacterota bacterium]